MPSRATIQGSLHQDDSADLLSPRGIIAPLLATSKKDLLCKLAGHAARLTDIDEHIILMDGIAHSPRLRLHTNCALSPSSDGNRAALRGSGRAGSSRRRRR